MYCWWGRLIIVQTIYSKSWDWNGVLLKVTGEAVNFLVRKLSPLALAFCLRCGSVQWRGLLVQCVPLHCHCLVTLNDQSLCCNWYYFLHIHFALILFCIILVYLILWVRFILCWCIIITYCRKRHIFGNSNAVFEMETLGECHWTNKYWTRY